MTFCSEGLQFKQAPLPRDQQRRALAFVRRHSVQRAARRNERRLEAMLVRHRIAAPAQLLGRALHRRGRPLPFPPEPDRPFRFRQTQRSLRRFPETLAPPGGKMPVIGKFPGRERFRRLEQEMVLQNMKRRAIGGLGFPVSPLPELAQNGGRAASQLSRTGNPPDFLFVAHALDRGLLELALARLAKPVQPLALPQFGFELFRQRARDNACRSSRIRPCASATAAGPSSPSANLSPA